MTCPFLGNSNCTTRRVRWQHCRCASEPVHCFAWNPRAGCRPMKSKGTSVSLTTHIQSLWCWIVWKGTVGGPTEKQCPLELGSFSTIPLFLQRCLFLWIMYYWIIERCNPYHNKKNQQSCYHWLQSTRNGSELVIALNSRKQNIFSKLLEKPRQLGRIDVIFCGVDISRIGVPITTWAVTCRLFACPSKCWKSVGIVWLCNQRHQQP